MNSYQNPMENMPPVNYPQPAYAPAGQFPQTGYAPAGQYPAPNYPPAGYPPAQAQPYPIGTYPTSMPVQESYIENILRLNLGKTATVYMNFENSQWGSKIFKGILRAAGLDHIILVDPDTGIHYLLLTIYLDYITFDVPINYAYPYVGAQGPSAPGPTQGFPSGAMPGPMATGQTPGTVVRKKE